jgi:hypothetical protein
MAVIFPRVPFRSRAPLPTSTPPSSPPPRASLPRDCPILRPRAVGCLSRAEGMRLSVRAELRSTHTPRAIPLILLACCGLLHACVETLQAPFELAAARGPTYLHAADYTRLFCSQDDRNAHQLCSGEDKHPQRHHPVGGVFPGWNQDCVRIGRQDDQSLGFWCAASSKSSLLGRN